MAERAELYRRAREIPINLVTGISRAVIQIGTPKEAWPLGTIAEREEAYFYLRCAYQALFERHSDKVRPVQPGGIKRLEFNIPETCKCALNEYNPGKAYSLRTKSGPLRGRLLRPFTAPLHKQAYIQSIGNQATIQEGLLGTKYVNHWSPMDGDVHWEPLDEFGKPIVLDAFTAEMLAFELNCLPDSEVLDAVHSDINPQ